MDWSHVEYSCGLAFSVAYVTTGRVRSYHVAMLVASYSLTVINHNSAPDCLSLAARADHMTSVQLT